MITQVDNTSRSDIADNVNRRKLIPISEVLKRKCSTLQQYKDQLIDFSIKGNEIYQFRKESIGFKYYIKKQVQEKLPPWKLFLKRLLFTPTLAQTLTLNQGRIYLGQASRGQFYGVRFSGHAKNSSLMIYLLSLLLLTDNLLHRRLLILRKYHNLLIVKFGVYGFWNEVLTYIENYLSNRLQRVRLNSCFSS